MGLSGMETNWRLAGRLAEPQEGSPDLADLEARAIEQSLDLKELENRYLAAARRPTWHGPRGSCPHCVPESVWGARTVSVNSAR